MSYGAKMPRVNYPKQLALLPVCLPSMEEQKAIAQYLEQRCGKLDAIIAIKQQQINTLVPKTWNIPDNSPFFWLDKHDTWPARYLR